MRYKRGQGEPELLRIVIRIIIAMIILLLLIGLVITVIYKRNSSLEQKQAKASLELILRSVADKKPEVVIFQPEGGILWKWKLISFPNANRQRPKQCIVNAWENCLCMCKSEAWTFSVVKECDKNGFCSSQDVAYKTSKSGSHYAIPMEGLPLTLELNHQDKTIKEK